MHLYDTSGALVGTTTTDANGFYRFDRLRPGTTYSVCLDNPADSAAGRPARGLRADRAQRGQRRRRSTPTASCATACRASRAPRRAPRARSSRPTTSASGSRPPSVTGSGRTRTTTASRTRASTASAASAWRCTTPAAPRSPMPSPTPTASTSSTGSRRAPTTSASRSRTIPSGFSLTTKDAPGSTRADGSDAGADGCAISTVLAPGQRDLDWDAGIWKAPRLRRWKRPLDRREGQPEAGAQEGRQARDRARRRGDPLHARRHERRQGDRARREGLRHAARRPDGDLDRRRQALGRPGLLDGRRARQGQAPAVHAAREGRPDAARAT